MNDKIYEHEVITTVRFTFHSLEPYDGDKKQLAEDMAWLTDFSDLIKGDDYPRVVATSVIDDLIISMDKEIDDA